ncbi:COR domain-containing protein [Crocosphaera sp.]|uniref:COR domain-containing protein n=1 Tax=Crocosphaera sp. TaxID=2729996 RepID=UPI002638CB9D|nr:COR domain-containing protein [Crocosphaera sp.]MDJ0578847.1 COR domain-containing protein [Crocosphaera sp.]
MTDEELLQVIEEAARDKIESLDLWNENLNSLPPEIGQLTNLTSLSLSNNQLTNLPSEICKLTNLTSLSLWNNQLTNLPSEICKLTNLTSLSLWNNQLTNIPAEIGQLTNLTSLSLSNNQLTNIPAEIGQLTNLTSLYLSNNQLTNIPAEIGQLTNLQVLSLLNNQLINLPPEISRLTNLYRLSVGLSQSNSLSSDLNIIIDLTNTNKIDRLSISFKKLINIPYDIFKITQLTALDLSNNQLNTIPSEIGQLSNLEILDLSKNKLNTLPKEISKLYNLRNLALRDNQFTKLPAEIGLLALQRLTYGNNPLQSPPTSIRKKGVAAIRNYLKQQLEQKIEHLYEAKLLIVGEPGAGKTTLAQKIKNNNYQLKTYEESTEGIDVIQWSFPLDNGKNFRVNIWDFGGQEIYKETHQFFLTERSLYTLVADTRKENTDFYYWLNVVELLSNSSPILVIKNEKQERKRDINERQLRGEFTNFKETLATNFATNRGLPEILNKIQHYISNLPHIGEELPAYWVKVREVLEQDTRDYITFEEYLNICKDKGFKELEDMLVLSGYFHDLGVFLHFQNDDLLQKTIILNTAWGTDAVYKVLDNENVRANLGKFNKNDLNNIWNEEKYITMRSELLKLMMNFKLCYEIPSQPGNYITPQLLNAEQPEYDWYEENNLLLRYEYEFMPKGILTRFIVETHAIIENETCVWKEGVVLTKDGARAEIIERYRYHKGEIRIRVSGTRKRDLLTTIRYELDKIHNSYERLKYKTLVPCNCSKCKGSQSPHFYPWDVLNKFIDDKQPTIQCPISYDMVNVQGLVNDIISPDRTPSINNEESEISNQYINNTINVNGSAQIHQQNQGEGQFNIDPS